MADIHVRDVDDAVWARFRIAAMADEKSFGEEMTDVLRAWIEAHPDLQPAGRPLPWTKSDQNSSPTRDTDRCPGHKKLGIDPQPDDNGKMRAECPDCHRRIMVTQAGRMQQHGAAAQPYDTDPKNPAARTG